jgi:hypothetical protein
MNTKMGGAPPNIAKAQTLEVTYGKRKWIIVSEGQLAYQRSLYKDLKMCDLAVNRIDVTDEQLNKMVDDWVRDECPYQTLDYVLGLMTPQERDLWKANYRFKGIGRPKS